MIFKYRAISKKTGKYIYGLPVFINGEIKGIQIDTGDINEVIEGTFSINSEIEDKNSNSIFTGMSLDGRKVVYNKLEGSFFAGDIPLCMSASHREIDKENE